MTKEEFFKRYTFNRETDRLGAGSFGSVYKAYDTVLDRWVALKIAPVKGESMRLSREVELVRRLPDHQNVAGYEDCYTFTETTGDIDVAVLRYYPEGSLADILSSSKLTRAEVRDVLCQILEGIRFLHANGVIHRDLKPGNILMARRPDGSLVAKITDFGISKSSDSDDDTVTAAVTVSYASPEQLSGMPVGRAADIWSFGVIAYRLLTGRLPFTSDDADVSSMRGRAQIINKITSGELPADIDGMPDSWKQLLSVCLVTDPHMRVTDEASLLRLISSASVPDLQKTYKDDDTKLCPSLPPEDPIPPKKGWSKTEFGFYLIVIITAAAMIVGVFVYLLLLPNKDNSDQPDNTPVIIEAVAPMEVVQDSDVYAPVDTTSVQADENYSPFDSSGYVSPESYDSAEPDSVGSANYFD